MIEPNLLVICLIAFIAVITILALMAIVIHLLSIIFPERLSKVDPVVVAAISSTVTSLLSGARVTRIEELSPSSDWIKL